MVKTRIQGRPKADGVYQKQASPRQNDSTPFCRQKNISFTRIISEEQTSGKNNDTDNCISPLIL